jgi:hypothetical protein
MAPAGQLGEDLVSAMTWTGRLPSLAGNLAGSMVFGHLERVPVPAAPADVLNFV